MGSINFLSTSNFSFSVISVNSDGVYTVEIKPVSKDGKALYRFKKWGKVQTMQSTQGSIFLDAEAYEAKVMALAAI